MPIGCSATGLARAESGRVGARLQAGLNHQVVAGRPRYRPAGVRPGRNIADRAWHGRDLPRADSCRVSSASGAQAWTRNSISRRAPLAHSSAWCTSTVGGEHADRGSRTSQPWQYGQCSTSRPHRSRSPGMSGSSSRRPVVTSSRRRARRPPSARVTANRSPSAARTASTRPSDDRRRRRAPPRGRPRAARPAAIPSRVRKLWTPSAGALRGCPRRSPAPTAGPGPASARRSVRRRRRRPPPRRSSFMSATSTAMLGTDARAVANFVADDGKLDGMDDDLGGGRPAAAGAAPAARRPRWPSCPRRPASR